MILKSILLKDFRNYSKSEFEFTKNTTIIVGPNTSGKSNLIEGIFFLASGKSFRTEKDENTIRFGHNLARIKGKVNGLELEALVANSDFNNRAFKKYLINGVSRKRSDFVGNLVCVIFSPQSLDIIIGSPSQRRRFLDDTLDQIDLQYRLSSNIYDKSLRQRNALLQRARESGMRQKEQFEYWDNLLIDNGQIITKKREEFIKFINNYKKDIFSFEINYDKSIISKERLLQYKNEEVDAGVTLVGPHRDDFFVLMNGKGGQTHDIRFFGSRGQQRLAILQLKAIELAFIDEKIQSRPVFLLDDIFSELDNDHIDLVFKIISQQQTIITTTHKEFVSRKFLKDVGVIELIRE